ncbi:MAG TPA: polyphosphate kinase 2 family protein [Pseudolabrys sp.]|jgi:PPK2 family polyphosphate:nucleotide phosphotransferase|nr:polyphosphate kinase 2 family protein [Pseudolabrys sp.]
MTLSSLTKRFRIDNPAKFRLSDYDPDDSEGLTKDKSEAKAMLAEGIQLLVRLQEKMYADDRWSVLIILQAMDAAGKDSVVEHVMSGLNPQGVQVHSFKQPSAEELDHDFLWRAARNLPERGRIGIFNRSYYEEVLVVRVHPEWLERQKLPKSLNGKDLWQQRFDDICAFERHLARNGTRILKFFLHVSKEEQRKRFLDRIDEPAKRWKFSMADVEERKFWDKYQQAYEDMIRHTSQPEAPWFVVPADHKWFTRMVVAGALVQELQALGVDFPKVEGKALEELLEAGKALKEEKS